jgi:hypothetical protein
MLGGRVITMLVHGCVIKHVSRVARTVRASSNERSPAPLPSLQKRFGGKAVVWTLSSFGEGNRGRPGVGFTHRSANDKGGAGLGP